MSSNWGVRDSASQYLIDQWGGGYFAVNDDGHVVVTPRGPDGPQLDVYDLVEELRARGHGLPVLLRFPDIITQRIHGLTAAFERAIQAEGYRGAYHCVYPIKVNQHRRVVEAVLASAGERPIGLEAGSKPEVLAAFAQANEPGQLLVLNGYKDDEYVETALLARKLGLNSILVIDRFRELDIAIRVSKRLGIPPVLGVRAQLDARVEGKWTESSGPGSKFGLDPEELVETIEKLEEHGLLDSLQLLHFHVGSQITGIQGLKTAAQEGARVYVELKKLGANMRYLDVGGGLAVDYDGTQSTNHSSMNYDMQEYANNVVFHVREMCDEAKVEHPEILTESGRAITAHHSLLVFDVPDLDDGLPRDVPPPIQDDEHRILKALAEAWRAAGDGNLLECWHDANHARKEAITLFASGVFNLRQRARADELFRACCRRVLDRIRTMPPDDVPEDLQDLERRFADIFFGNFSIFQSAPDNWAVGQLFPIMPIHRLGEEPTRRGVVADLTCDSDGMIDRFIGDGGEEPVLRLHEANGRPYYVGVFLLGAYQEILGDLHNLFGDTNAVHVSIDEAGRPILADIVEHDSVTEVLGYVGYDRRFLLAKVRKTVERALRDGTIDLAESSLFLRDYENGLAGTTYLEAEHAPGHESGPTSELAGPGSLSDSETRG